MYRAVIEHPDWVPDELKRRPDQLDGMDRGRIYRIVRRGASPVQSANLVQASNTDLIAALAHPNSWQRETASRLLLERQDVKQGALRDVVMYADSLQARLRALYLLQSLERLSAELLLDLLDTDLQPPLLEHVVAVAAPHLPDHGRLQAKLRTLCDHDHARVRFQSLLALAPRAVVPNRISDEWELLAVLICAGRNAGTLLSELRAKMEQPHGNGPDAWSPALLAELIGRLSELAVASNDDVQARLALEALLGSGRFARHGLARYLKIATRKGVTISDLESALSSELRGTLNQHFAESLTVATDATETVAARLEAIDLLKYQEDAVDRLEELAMEEPISNVRIHAIQAMQRHGKVSFWRNLMDRYRHESPAIRTAVIHAMFANSERLVLLLDAVESGQIKVSELDQAQVNRLLRHPDGAMQRRARQLLADAIPADRQKALDDYQAALSLPADPVRGRAVFRAHCANCHRIDDLGTSVAPDISDSRTKSPQQYLTDIIQPNRAIDANYVAYSVATQQGELLNGIVVSETSTSITLKQLEGKTATLLREDIEYLSSSGVSFMPDGLEKNISHQQMADLISFIKNWRYLDGRTPVNIRPETPCGASNMNRIAGDTEGE